MLLLFYGKPNCLPLECGLYLVTGCYRIDCGRSYCVSFPRLVIKRCVFLLDLSWVALSGKAGCHVVKKLQHFYGEAPMTRNWSFRPRAAKVPPWRSILRLTPNKLLPNYSPGQHLACNLMTDPGPEPPTSAMAKFLPRGNCEMINVGWFQLWMLRMICNTAFSN